ncbi:MAG: peptidoglycan DD-metalloendopeptidase family protein [Acidobacteria bacterium]|nr:peptidoglycan DD-metalloendopeptidase family protein [Acidobacteriota bacterium]
MARRWLVTAVLLTCVAAGVAGQASDPSSAAALAARATERIRALQAEADRLAAQARTLFNDLRALELDRAIAQEGVTGAEARLTEVTAKRDEAAARVEKLEAERVANTPGVAERLVSIYKRGRGGYARLLLASDDPRAFGRLTRGVAAIAALDNVRVESHRRTLAAERAALADLETRRAEVSASQQTATTARADLEKAVAARNRAIDGLDQRRDLAAQYVSELQQAQAALQRTVGGLESAPPDLPFKPFRGALDWPVRGRLVSRFGTSRDNRFGTAIVRNGIEIGAAEGTAVTAVHGGIAAYVAPFTGFGNLIILDHGGGAFTMYGHLASTNLTQGQRVPRGTTIGTVGLAPAGSSALYFEVRIDGRPADPLEWLRSSP